MSEAETNARGGGVLSREQLQDRIIGNTRPIVTDWLDLDTQLQPNGIDLTVRSIAAFDGPGTIGDDNSTRQLPELRPIAFDDDGWVSLQTGPYQIVFNEIVDIPIDLMALGRPRSSLGRCGVTIHTSVWDAGYTGRSTSLLFVLNTAGFRLQRNARVMQLVFVTLDARTADGYAGAYQHENVRAST